MKKKIVIPVIIVLVLIISIVLFLALKKDNKEESFTFTMDINPSFEITGKGDKVEKITLLNEESDGFVNHDMEGKDLDQVFDDFVKQFKEKGLLEDDELFVILGFENENKVIEDKLREACDRQSIRSNIIVPVITEDAKKEADGYGVTPAKAAYILEVMKDNDKLQFDDLKDKSSKELNTMKKTGLYCDNGYTLRGELCEKIIKEEKPEEGKTCPGGYEDVNKHCYKVGPVKHEPYCKSPLELKDGKCVGTETVAAEAKCSEGTYNEKTKKCEKQELVGAATKACKEDKDLLLDNGKCASVHAGAHSHGEEGEVDPATECCCGDTYKNGWCYSLPNGNYDAILKCPSGQTLKDGKCYKTTTIGDPTYSCSKGELEGTKCVIETSKEPTLKVTCEKGLATYKDRTCLDYNVTEEYIVGLVCSKDAKLEGDKCVYYEVVEAKR